MQSQSKTKLFNKPVPSTYCVKVDGQKLWDNMPQPNPKPNPEAEHAISQKLLQTPTQKLEANMPSEMMPTVHGRDHQHQQGAANPDQMAVLPPNPDLEDAAINAEMVKLQITLESEKTERFKRVEARRRKDEERKVTLESEKRERFKQLEVKQLQEEEQRCLA